MPCAADFANSGSALKPQEPLFKHVMRDAVNETTGSKRKLSEDSDSSEPPRKKFKYDSNPNLHKNLFSRLISNYKKAKNRKKWETSFLKQYRSNLGEKLSEARITDLYRQGGSNGTGVRVVTKLTEAGCGAATFGCWCKKHIENLRRAEERKQNLEREAEKRAKFLAKLKNLNSKIKKQGVNGTSTVPSTKKSRWGS